MAIGCQPDLETGAANGGRSPVTDLVERVARAILTRRTKPDFVEMRDGAWVVDQDKELASAAIAAVRDAIPHGAARTILENAVGEHPLQKLSDLGQEIDSVLGESDG